MEPRYTFRCLRLTTEVAVRRECLQRMMMSFTNHRDECATMLWSCPRCLALIGVILYNKNIKRYICTVIKCPFSNISYIFRRLKFELSIMPLLLYLWNESSTLWDINAGGASIVKVYTDVRLEVGLQVYEWVSFSPQKYVSR